VDFLTWGTVLGPKAAFRKQLAVPIEKSRERNAGKILIREGEQAMGILTGKTKEFVLGRMKKDVIRVMLPQLYGAPFVDHSMLGVACIARKYEATLWIKMTPSQVRRCICDCSSLLKYL
jgi:hypothetical protein